ncbi:inhibitor of nuclear factor kappa-B kinase-interacting protein isoform X2 [Bufo gargarizans]|uniref:inhibitor of nuclear factor kappa-B kinase-interacting protein isoform X2 n=1 Tax=Bufo gargarizans TaxID=30331 RepID=UPI001CF0DE87|nr:inhibitor of nuclear factor kappa-B kinase-interacting protein isoform X2 [Bufo gargarizans]
MSSEAKQRKKGSSPSTKELKDGAGSGQRPQEEKQKKIRDHSPVPASGSSYVDFRTVLCSLCLAVCVALAWMVFQQSQNFTTLEQKYQSLQSRSSELHALEEKVSQIFGKMAETTHTVTKLKDLQISQRMELLQKDIVNIEEWISLISAKREQLEVNLTALEESISQVEQTTTSISKEVSAKIATVKTDVRRISGMETDIKLLTDSINELEEKLEKVEKNTAQKIGDALANSIDRMTSLKSSVSRNSDRIDLIKIRLMELRGNFTDNSDKLSSLESDRLKVLQAVNFANELKPKIFTIKKDFAHLEAMINDLSARIGRLASDILNREKDINLLSDKMYNITVMKSEVLDLSNKISNV